MKTPTLMQEKVLRMLYISEEELKKGIKEAMADHPPRAVGLHLGRLVKVKGSMITALKQSQLKPDKYYRIPDVNVEIKVLFGIERPDEDVVYVGYLIRTCADMKYFDTHSYKKLIPNMLVSLISIGAGFATAIISSNLILSFIVVTLCLVLLYFLIVGDIPKLAYTIDMSVREKRIVSRMENEVLNLIRNDEELIRTKS